MNSSSRSISTVFEIAANGGPNRDFLHVPADACRAYSDGPLTLSFGEARARIDVLASRFQAAGYEPGHRVALALDNRPDFFLYFLALAKAGISVLPLNASMSVRELTYIMSHGDVALAVTHQGHATHVRAALPGATPLYVQGGEDAALEHPGGPLVADAEEAALLYTSGTTGTPKGCILTQEYFIEIGRLYTGLGGYCRFDGTGDRLATPLPVTHMNALACSFMAVLMTGGCLIQLDRFHPSTWWHSIRASRATMFHYLGVMPAMLLNAPASGEDDVSATVRFGFGAGVDPRHQTAFESRFGVPLIEAWAMTETGAGAWITANREPRHPGQRCFGKAPPGLSYRIVNAEGADTSPGTAGELLVKRDGPEPRRGFFNGYYKDALATSLVWDGGWFHTGDLVRIGEDGCFFFVDRSKNIVRRSGENIAAVEVESARRRIPMSGGPFARYRRGAGREVFFLSSSEGFPRPRGVHASAVPLSDADGLLQGAGLCGIPVRVAANGLAETCPCRNQSARRLRRGVGPGVRLETSEETHGIRRRLTTRSVKMTVANFCD